MDQKIGDYEIIKSLGRGGFGSVWKATASSGNIVALKILNPQVLDNARVVKKFFHEAMILAKLDHPNICKLLEFFPDGNNYAIVMEYIEGVELKKLLKDQDGQLPFDQANKIAQQSLAAFQYAHENGILHRDIKPGNIMINKNGDSKIMDFGIAKISTTASHDTAAKMLSVHYVPPERFDPKKEIDARSDIYSLALVFYEIFTGRRAFMVEETSQIMFCHLNEIPDPPEKYRPDMPHEISQAISRALEKDPDDRFKDFNEFSAAMKGAMPIPDDATQAVDVETLKPEPVSEVDIEKKTKKKSPVLMIASIAVVVIALLVGGYFAYNMYFLQGPEPGPGPEDTVTETEPGKPAELPYGKDKSIMIVIPKGEFEMGSDKYSAEKPVQKIYLDNYYIDKFLVTNAQFRKFVEQTQYVTDAEKAGGGMVRIGRRWKKIKDATWKMPDGLTPIEGQENNPVSQVSFNDASAYCKWAGKDLPTEAQWEKAARGTDGREYPWGNHDPDDTMANFDNLIGATTPVQDYEKGKSPYGVYDAAGNVYQWCKDWYGTGQRAEKNPTGPASGKEHVVKGGSFIEGTESLRSANRDRYKPDYSSYLFGFRCACEKK
ncbi:MAG: SUMF1/EgtB/PvdO family nonheme iron enzyme [Deltaproteobacteria bacterium]|nr:SUMF1/EgtB/PvdO family nonheme iron enzyme [Deltaproteobacteria bacterium]